MRAPSLINMEKILVVQLIVAAAAATVASPATDVSSEPSLDAKEFSTNTTHFLTERAEEHEIDTRSEDECINAKGVCFPKKKVLKKCKGIIDTRVTCSKKKEYCCLPDVICPTPASTPAPVTCSDGWVYGGPNLGCVLFVSDGKSWDAARGHCQSLGGGADLAVVDTQAKRDEMVNLDAHTAQNRGYWVGASDRSGSWEWINSAGLVSTGWVPGYPNQDSGDDTCTWIYNEGTPNMILDYTCTGTWYFICQI